MDVVGEQKQTTTKMSVQNLSNIHNDWLIGFLKSETSFQLELWFESNHRGLALTAARGSAPRLVT